MNSVHNIDKYGVMMREGWMTIVLMSAKRVVHWLNIEMCSALFTLHNLIIVNYRNLLNNRISCVPLFSGYAFAERYILVFRKHLFMSFNSVYRYILGHLSSLGYTLLFIIVFRRP